MDIRLKRAYEPASPSDGYRVLVDRLWPRGLSKERAMLDEWAKDLPPSTELREWFGHEPSRFAEFRRRYVNELREQRPRLTELRRRASHGTLTLVYSARDTEHNDAVVLAEILRRGLPRQTITQTTHHARRKGAKTMTEHQKKNGKIGEDTRDCRRCRRLRRGKGSASLGARRRSPAELARTRCPRLDVRLLRRERRRVPLLGWPRRGLRVARSRSERTPPRSRRLARADDQRTSEDQADGVEIERQVVQGAAAEILVSATTPTTCWSSDPAVTAASRPPARVSESAMRPPRSLPGRCRPRPQTSIR